MVNQKTTKAKWGIWQSFGQRLEIPPSLVDGAQNGKCTELQLFFGKLPESPQKSNWPNTPTGKIINLVIRRKANSFLEILREESGKSRAAFVGLCSP